MLTHRTNRIRNGMAVFILISLLLSACTLPIPGLPTQAPTNIPGITGAMLTAAAATINAHFNAQNSPTPQPAPTEVLPATNPPEMIPTSEPQTLPTTETQPAATQTILSLETSTPEPSQQDQAATATPLGSVITLIPVTVIPVTMVPTSPEIVEYGAQFKMQNVNLHPCSGGFNAVFKIYNQSSSSLESLSLQMQDLTTGAILLGAWVSDAPFINTDRTCASGGIDSLASGQTLYIGNSLGGSNLSGHTIRTTILLCSKESLAGTCSQKMIDFIVP